MGTQADILYGKTDRESMENRHSVAMGKLIDSLHIKTDRLFENRHTDRHAWKTDSLYKKTYILSLSAAKFTDSLFEKK
jgi:hypothetical protein